MLGVSTCRQKSIRARHSWSGRDGGASANDVTRVRRSRPLLGSTSALHLLTQGLDAVLVTEVAERFSVRALVAPEG